MDKFVIEGGERLSGTVKIGGAKNAVLPIMAASLLAEKGETIINQVPELTDIDTMIQVLKYLGAEVKRDLKDKKVSIKADNLKSSEAPYDLVRRMRASFLVLGPVLVRLGKAKVSLPGGCVIGQRPVNFHLLGQQSLGAKLKEEHGYIVASCDALKGTTICFDRPTHTGTENLMMAATLGTGRTTLINAACDPEVADLAKFLNLMGAKIDGVGTSTMSIKGTKSLKAVEYTPISDRLEAGTFMMAAGITGGYIEIRNTKLAHLRMVNQKLRDMGLDIQENKGRVKVKGPKRLKEVRVTTYPHPGFPTDLQASIMALACVAEGGSEIRETVFEERFTHVMELNRLGADIKVEGNKATVCGVPGLKGATVMASDIRAGAGLALAGLVAEGVTEILRVYHIDRGYDNFETKLATLGARIKRIKD
jgi:UDP-N-acetylglucosamine 1-carboxyvinyltransferase